MNICVIFFPYRCYTFAEMPWYQRRIAKVLFATPPSSTYEEVVWGPLSVTTGLLTDGPLCGVCSSGALSSEGRRHVLTARVALTTEASAYDLWWWVFVLPFRWMAEHSGILQLKNPMAKSYLHFLFEICTIWKL